MLPDTKASSGGFRRDEYQMVQDGPARFSQSQSVYQRGVAATGQSICNQSRTLGTLFGHRREAAQQSNRTHIGQLSGEALMDVCLGGLPTRKQDLAGGRGRA
jgi:hypothetical protein